MAIHKSGYTQRVNFGKIKQTFDYPDLLGIEIDAFKKFFQIETTPENRSNEGLYAVFRENFPISDARNIFTLEFLDYFIDPMSLPTGPNNDMTRRFYPDTSYNYPDPQVELLFSEYGPMWYRGDYTGKVRATQAQVDSTLALFNAKYIVTGHTIIADTISVLYRGKVFNTDVYHTKGSSEGLLYEGNAFYRVNALGEKKRIR